ncbi:hypothetical protein F5148DRAFT_1156376 [Russula earlei]|uniref:Uncharacterized protein n=1 Tax=Russula earlei TaxID=71964 RepID=A0ACC0UPR0_9AGAM|nr:hypothetical protein F5148DRAFT_1156376 [Russula earlei]
MCRYYHFRKVSVGLKVIVFVLERPLASLKNTSLSHSLSWVSIVTPMPASNREELTQINADAKNWTWTRGHWHAANDMWKDFADNVRKKQPLKETLDLCNVSSPPTKTMLVRECYRETEDVVWLEVVVNDPDGGVIFTSQPGIGKLLIKRGLVGAHH